MPDIPRAATEAAAEAIVAAYRSPYASSFQIAETGLVGVAEAGWVIVPRPVLEAALVHDPDTSACRLREARQQALSPCQMHATEHDDPCRACVLLDQIGATP